MLKKYKSMLLILFTLLLVSCDSTEVELRFTVLKARSDGGISYSSCDRKLKCGRGGGIGIGSNFKPNFEPISGKVYSKRAYIYLDGDITVRLEMFIENKNCGNYTLDYKKGTIFDNTNSRLFIVECNPKK